MNSQEYWNNRWAGNEGKYEASWRGDPHMRMLELDLIREHLHSMLATPRIVDLGCGAFTLDEHPELAQMLKPVSYWGLDTSSVAVEMAQQSNPEHAFHNECASTFLSMNLGFNFAISRRTLQNMAPLARRKAIESLESVPNGIVLECTQEGLVRCNRVRLQHGLKPIGQPEFNQYLSEADVQLLEKVTGARRTFPFSHYYLRTRAQVPCRTPAGDILAFWGHVTGGRCDTPNIGPHTVWRW